MNTGRSNKQFPNSRFVADYFYLESNRRDFRFRNPARRVNNKMELDLQIAWNTINLISKEYNYMWDKLEKLELLLYQQQNVIGQLLSALITTGESNVQIIHNPDSDISIFVGDNQSFLPKYTEEIEQPVEQFVPVDITNKTEDEGIIQLDQNITEKKTDCQDDVNQREDIDQIKAKNYSTEDVFTSNDYVQFHEETKPIVTETDIESLIEIEKFLNFKKKYSISRKFDSSKSVNKAKQVDDSTNQSKETNFESSETAAHKQFVDLIEKCESISKSSDVECLDLITKSPELDFQNELDTANDQTTPVGSRRVSYSDFRPALVKEDPIDEQTDIYEFSKPFNDHDTNVTGVFPTRINELDLKISEQKCESDLAEVTQVNTELVCQETIDNVNTKVTDNKAEAQKQQDLNKSTKPNENGPTNQHRRFNSLEENSILSSFTNSMKQSYQNVLSRSSIFKKDSKESISTPAPSAPVPESGSNIKSSIKSIFGGFKSLQESMSKDDKMPNQKEKHQLSLPELNNDKIVPDENVSKVTMAHSEQRVEEQNPATLKIENASNSIELCGQDFTPQSEKFDKMAFRAQSMQEANTMMDTLKVNTIANDHQKKIRLEKSFSDESAIFSFSPGSRQSSLLQSETEQIPFDINSAIELKETNDEQVDVEPMSNQDVQTEDVEKEKTLNKGMRQMVFMNFF